MIFLDFVWIRISSVLFFLLPYFHCLLTTKFHVLNSEMTRCRVMTALAHHSDCVPRLNAVCVLGETASWQPVLSQGFAEMLGDTQLVLGGSLFSCTAEMVLDKQFCLLMPCLGATSQTQCSMECHLDMVI